MKIDLQTIGDRLQAAAARCDGLTVTVSSSDLILSRDGYGTYQFVAVPLMAIFLSDDDLVGKALDRLEAPQQQAA